MFKLFNLFKEKPISIPVETPIQEPIPEPKEERNPKLVKLIKAKIDRIKGKVKHEYKPQIWMTVLSIEEIAISHDDYFNIYSTNLAVWLSKSDKKEIFEYLQDRRAKEIAKDAKKAEKKFLKYLKN